MTGVSFHYMPFSIQRFSLIFFIISFFLSKLQVALPSDLLVWKLRFSSIFLLLPSQTAFQISYSKGSFFITGSIVFITVCGFFRSNLRQRQNLLLCRLSLPYNLKSPLCPEDSQYRIFFCDIKYTHYCLQYNTYYILKFYADILAVQSFNILAI